MIQYSITHLNETIPVNNATLRLSLDRSAGEYKGTD